MSHGSIGIDSWYLEEEEEGEMNVPQQQMDRGPRTLNEVDGILIYRYEAFFFRKEKRRT